MTLALSAAQQEVVLASQDDISRIAKHFLRMNSRTRPRLPWADIKQAATLAFMEALVQFDCMKPPGKREEYCELAILAKLRAMSRQSSRETQAEIDPLIESDIEEIDNIDLLATLLKALDPWDRKLISMRYGIDLPRTYSQEEVALELEVSRETVARNEARIARLLKNS